MDLAVAIIESYCAQLSHRSQIRCIGATQRRQFGRERVSVSGFNFENHRGADLVKRDQIDSNCSVLEIPAVDDKDVRMANPAQIKLFMYFNITTEQICGRAGAMRIADAET
jgi:hypothetical protein